MATLHETEFLEALERITPQWLAGFFDGEGCISIVKHRGMPSLRVDLTQAEYNILHLIGLKFDGRDPHKKYGKLAKKQGWCLAFCGKSALLILEYIQPHVVLKRKLVAWAIEMAHLHGTPGGNRRWGKGKLPTATRKRREEIYEAVRTENKSGRLPTIN